MYDKQIRRYIRNVDRKLSCPNAERALLHKQLHNMCEEFMSEHPAATWEELYAFLGRPEDVANTCMDSLDAELLQRYSQRKRLCTRICLLAFILAFAVITTLFAILLNSSRTPITVEYTIDEIQK